MKEQRTRKPLSNVYVQEQQVQRVQNHPSNRMAHPSKRKGVYNTRRNASKKSKPHDEHTDEEASGDESATTATGTETKLWQKIVLNLQNDLAKYNARDKSKKVPQKDKTEMEKLVYSTAKHQFFKQCKYLNEKSLKKGAKWVYNYIKPKEIEGMPANFREMYDATWVSRYQDEVRKGINDKRTNIQQEMLKLYKKKIAAGQHEVLVTNATEVWDLLERRDLEDSDDLTELNRAKFDFLVDEVIPKFATSDAWGPNYRHTTIMMQAEQTVPEGKPQQMCVSISDLAYVHSYYVSYGSQLDWELRSAQGTLDRYPEDHEVEAARGNMCYEGTDAAGKPVNVYFEKRPDPKHIKSEGGRCPFGGWTKEGIAIYKDKRERLKELYRSGTRTADYQRVKKADEECLARLRVKHNRDNVEQKRRARGRGNAAEHEEDGDEGDDFDD